MSISAEKIKYKDSTAVSLKAGRYEAVIAPFMGSNIISLKDIENKIDFFRFDDTLSIEELQKAAEVYGFPTLYLPNRLSKGVLKASDYTYQFPINDPLGNYIHGWMHQRVHTVTYCGVNGSSAVCKTSYTFDEKDEMFAYYPVKFRADFTFSLSDEGMSYELTMTNLSNRMLPFGICSHNCMKGPFTEGGDGMDVRLYVPIGDKVKLGKDCIPTLELMPLDGHDKQYLTGSCIPVHQDLDNDMYEAIPGSLDDKPFHGITATDIKTGKSLVLEVCKDFIYWIVWNDRGEKGYFCPEPITWIIDAPNLPIPAEESGYQEIKLEASKTLTMKLYTK